MRYVRFSTIVSSVSVLVVFGFVSSGLAMAGTQDGTVIVLHAKAHTTKSVTLCTTWLDAVPCSQFNTTWPLFTATDVYLVVARAQAGPGIAAVSCGIAYNPVLGSPDGGVDVLGWTTCPGVSAFPNAGANGDWPAAGGGNRIVWNDWPDCQRAVIEPDGVHAAAGVFYIYAYSPDAFQITPNNNLLFGPELQVADCDRALTDLPQSVPQAAIGFGGLAGYNPCSVPIPVAPSTWGSLKQKFVK